MDEELSKLNTNDQDKTTEKERLTFSSRLSQHMLSFWYNNNKELMSVIYTVSAILLFLTVWEILCLVGALSEPQFFRPTLIIQRIFELMSKENDRVIIYDTLASFSRMLISFLIAALIGIVIGLLMGWSKVINSFFDPIITFFMPIPGIAWAPLIFIWVGFEPIFSRWGLISTDSWWWNYGLGNPILIVIGIIAGVFPVIQNISIATKATDKKLIWAAKTMGAENMDIFRKVLLPNSLPYLFTGLKLGLARCWRTIIATEFLSAAIQGLGYLIFFSRTLGTRSNLMNIYAGIFVLSIVFYSIELLIKAFEKQTIEKWGMVRKAGTGIE